MVLWFVLPTLDADLLVYFKKFVDLVADLR